MNKESDKSFIELLLPDLLEIIVVFSDDYNTFRNFCKIKNNLEDENRKNRIEKKLTYIEYGYYCINDSCYMEDYSTNRNRLVYADIDGVYEYSIKSSKKDLNVCINGCK